MELVIIMSGTAMMMTAIARPRLQATITAVAVGGKVGLQATMSAVSVGGVIILGGAPDVITAAAVSEPSAVVSQPPTAVAASETIWTNAVPPGPSAVADTTTATVRVLDMAYVAEWRNFSAPYRQHNAALTYFRPKKWKGRSIHLTHPPLIWRQRVGPKLRSSTATKEAWEGSGGVGTS